MFVKMALSQTHLYGVAIYIHTERITAINQLIYIHLYATV